MHENRQIGRHSQFPVREFPPERSVPPRRVLNARGSIQPAKKPVLVPARDWIADWRDSTTVRPFPEEMATPNPTDSWRFLSGL